MIPHLLNLKYYLTHKFWVFRCGLLTKAPIWRLIIHDWSKLRPREWFPYTNYFWKEGGVRRHRVSKGWHDPDAATDEFNKAWRSHIAVNPHHWQFWLPNFDENAEPEEMPEEFVREMVADWMGAGIAQGKRGDIWNWWENHQEKIVLHPNSRALVNQIIYKELPNSY